MIQKSRQQEITKPRAEIKQKQDTKSQWNRVVSLRKISKIGKPLPKLTKMWSLSKLTKWEMKGYITDTKEIQENHKSILKTHILPNWITWKKWITLIGNIYQKSDLKRPIIPSQIEAVIKSIPTEKIPRTKWI